MDRGGERHTAKEGGKRQIQGRVVQEVLRSVLLSQRSRPVIALGCGCGVLPLVIYHPLKC